MHIQQTVNNPRPAMTLDPKFKGSRVLIMDDNQMAINSLSKLLSRLEFETETSRDGAEAVGRYKDALLSGRPYDLVIFDLQVPGGMGGDEALKQIMQIDGKVKAIIHSGDTFSPVLAHFRRYGFRAAMSKPCGLTELLAALEKTL